MSQCTLYYGDNLTVLREHVGDELIDLIYLDPPFNSNATYNVLFEEHDGTAAEAQIQAFDDTWHWDTAASSEFEELITSADPVANAMVALRQLLGTSNLLAYLTRMAIRFVELRRVLKPTGSIYLHCDCTASHYLKIVMDAVFGARNFLNNIVWLYGLGGSSRRYWPRKHDDLLWYSKEPGNHFFDPVMVPATSLRMKGKDKKCPDYWNIPSLNNMAQERLG